VWKLRWNGILAEFGEHFEARIAGRITWRRRGRRAGLEIDESGGDFVPSRGNSGRVAETAVGESATASVTTAVHFNVRNEAFEFGDGIFDAEFAQASMEGAPEDWPAQRWPWATGGQIEVFVRRSFI